ncbi:MAG: filamentous hemagglutinin N-terminal domain-containing protein [Candidatus Pacebacteria bacterium]|nr:filamentous hemagglutinin N-terminal domain-containing protein [Candidatus Paceibacterota bacterium]
MSTLTTTSHKIIHHLHQDLTMVQKQISQFQNHFHLHGLIANPSGAFGHLRHELMMGSATLVLLTVLSQAPAAKAAPSGGAVAAGSATITQTNGNRSTTINQSTTSAVINWNSFDVAPGDTVTFNVPNYNSSTLNRINSASASTISGTVTSNGSLYFVNPNGMVFSNGSNVSAVQLFATTGSISDATFQAGVTGLGNFVAPTGGSITLNGTINAYRIGAESKVMDVGGTLNANNDGESNARTDYLGTKRWLNVSSISLKANNDVTIKSGASLISGGGYKGGVISIYGGTSAKVQSNVTLNASTTNSSSFFSSSGGKINIKSGGNVSVAGTLRADHHGTVGVRDILTQTISEAGAVVIESTGGYVGFEASAYAHLDNITLKAAGDVGISGDGNFDNLRIISGGQVIQHGESALTVGTLSIAAKNGIEFYGANRFGTINGATTDAGAYYLASGGNVKLRGEFSNKAGRVALLFGNADIGDSLTVNSSTNIVLQGTYTGNYGATLNFKTGNNGPIHADWVVMNNIKTVNLSSDSGLVANLAMLAGFTANGDLNLTSGGNIQLLNQGRFETLSIRSGGAVTQSATSPIIANSLTVTARTGITLNASQNSFATINGATTDSGELNLASTGTVTLNGNYGTKNGWVSMSLDIVNFGSSLNIASTSSIYLAGTYIGSSGSTVNLQTGNFGALYVNNAALNNATTVNLSSQSGVLLELGGGFSNFVGQKQLNVTSVGDTRLANQGGFKNLKITAGGAITETGSALLTAENLELHAGNGIALNGVENHITNLKGVTNERGMINLLLTRGVNITGDIINKGNETWLRGDTFTIIGNRTISVNQGSRQGYSALQLMGVFDGQGTGNLTLNTAGNSNIEWFPFGTNRLQNFNSITWNQFVPTAAAIGSLTVEPIIVTVNAAFFAGDSIGSVTVNADSIRLVNDAAEPSSVAVNRLILNASSSIVEDNGTVFKVNSLTASANRGITLGSNGNSFGVINGLSTDSGDIVINNAGNAQLNGTISSRLGSVIFNGNYSTPDNLTVTAGNNITINGQFLGLRSGTATLSAGDNRAIVIDGGAVIDGFTNLTLSNGSALSVNLNQFTNNKTLNLASRNGDVRVVGNLNNGETQNLSIQAWGTITEASESSVWVNKLSLNARTGINFNAGGNYLSGLGAISNSDSGDVVINTGGVSPWGAGTGQGTWIWDRISNYGGAITLNGNRLDFGVLTTNSVWAAGNITINNAMAGSRGKSVTIHSDSGTVSFGTGAHYIPTLNVSIGSGASLVTTALAGNFDDYRLGNTKYSLSGGKIVSAAR